MKNFIQASIANFNESSSRTSSMISFSHMTSGMSNQPHGPPPTSEISANIPTAGTPDLNKLIELFNKKPVKAIEQLLALKFVENSVPKIAEFLLHTKPLKKGAVGEYLGSK